MTPELANTLFNLFMYIPAVAFVAVALYAINKRLRPFKGGR